MASSGVQKARKIKTTRSKGTTSTRRRLVISRMATNILCWEPGGNKGHDKTSNYSYNFLKYNLPWMTKIPQASTHTLSLQRITLLIHSYLAYSGRSPTQGLSHLCVQRVIWTHRTQFFDSLDTQMFRSGLADDDNFRR